LLLARVNASLDVLCDLHAAPRADTCITLLLVKVRLLLIQKLICAHVMVVIHRRIVGLGIRNIQGWQLLGIVPPFLQVITASTTMVLENVCSQVFEVIKRPELVLRRLSFDERLLLLLLQLLLRLLRCGNRL